jgi:hypothetical protein
MADPLFLYFKKTESLRFGLFISSAGAPDFLFSTAYNQKYTYLNYKGVVKRKVFIWKVTARLAIYSDSNYNKNNNNKNTLAFLANFIDFLLFSSIDK